MSRKAVIVDTDPALGVPRRDVDDGLALLMLLAAPDLDLRGVTITFGNVAAPVGFAQARDLLSRAHASPPVFAGARSRHDRGKRTAAAEFLVETVRASPGEISLLAIGPLTNVATAIELDPAFTSQLRELVIMGGALDFGLISFFGEFNFKCDAVSAARVLAAPVAKTLITTDVISHAVFRQAQLEQLRRRGSPMTRYLVPELAAWLRINRLLFPRSGGFYPWDPVAVAYVTNPELFDENPYRLDLTTTGLRAGRIRKAERLASFEPVAGGVPINVPLQLDGDAFLHRLMDALLSFGEREGPVR